jgi:hypothetical protein
LRAEAADELSVLSEERIRDGEDPWDFMEDLPSVDELVVLTLRAENIASDGGNKPTVVAQLPGAATDLARVPRTDARGVAPARQRTAPAWDASVRARHPDARARGQGAAYRAGRRGAEG